MEPGNQASAPVAISEPPVTQQPTAATAEPTRPSGAGWGAFLGVFTFLGGIGLIGLTFSFAYTLFNTPPETALGLRADQPLDANVTGRLLIGILYRIVLLILMCIAGSMIATRGIKLYGASRAPRHS